MVSLGSLHITVMTLIASGVLAWLAWWEIQQLTENGGFASTFSLISVAGLASVIHQQTPHHLGGRTEKLLAVLPVSRTRGDQVPEGIVHEHGFLPGARLPFFAKQGPGHFSEALLDQPEQGVTGLRIACGPFQ
jgi:hypothetical protein